MKYSAIDEVKGTFDTATSATKFKAALRKARRLERKAQFEILPSLFEAADRLEVERSTGEPLGMEQMLDGSVTVTWQTATRRPDGTFARTVSSAVIEPTDFGSGWKSRTKDVPEEVLDAVTAAALANELVCTKQAAKKKRRIYVR